MRSLTLLGSLALIGGAMLVGCGDDTTATGGSSTGGSNTGGESTGANNTGAGTTGGNGGNGGSGPGTCVEITDVTDFTFSGGGTVVPSLGGADPDFLQLILTAMQAPGMTTFTMPANAAECGDTAVCNAVFEDATMDGVAVIYLANSGSMNLQAFDGQYYGSGTMTDVTFAEIAIDQMTGDITTVPNGKCVHVASFAFNVEPPVAGWTCDPGFYSAMDGCDCECGAADPDCMDPMAMIYGCQPGQTCDANGQCAGLPTGWTCAADQFDQGAGNGCDCACGAYDPDCDIMGEPVQGCANGTDICSGAGKCVPAAWTCNPAFYDTGAMADCDCGCGVQDPDCADLNATSCDYCDDAGSCNTDPCPGTIATANNATCM